MLNKTPIVIHTIHGFAFHDYMNSFKKNIFIYLEKLSAKWTDGLVTVSNLNKKTTPKSRWDVHILLV